ncbi:hydrogenase maturation protease [Infirmifilum lucidum]|uniref:Hydrogenase maturation protease n=1 Tax=Infirmifilum lucidum TaxID=2776706 RepID=A0A7L9FGM1_9CREN|nr:hydrogenase maturation protease [Infirmifilum lucidum]QOJ78771.1 hydrogenase maturation protease [Infirmifilum lucidum]
MSTALDSLLEEVRSARRVVLVGLGNTLRGDDGVGVFIARRLAKRGLKDKVVVAGPNPEFFVREIASREPELVVFLDAVDAGLPPGSVVVAPIPGGEARVPPLSTHAIPLSLLVEALGVRAYLLGVQVEDTELGSRMSPRVRRAGESLAEKLLAALASR